MRSKRLYLIPNLIFFLKNVNLNKYEIEYDEGEDKIEDIIGFIFEISALYNQVAPQHPTSKEPVLAPEKLLKAQIPKMPKISGVISKDNVETVIKEGLPNLVDIVHVSEYPTYGGQIGWSEDVFEFLGDSVGTRTSSVMSQTEIDGTIIDQRKKDWTVNFKKTKSIKTLGGSLHRSPTKDQINSIQFPKHRILLSMIEGGNMLTGKDFVIIGKDSLSVIMSEYKIDENESKEMIAFDFGINKDNIFFIRQLDYHIDTYMQLLNDRCILMSKPAVCDSNPDLYIEAKKELEELKFKIIETSVNPAVNGEFVKNKLGELLFITNQCNDSDKIIFAKLLFANTEGLTAIYFTDKNLGGNGGIGCMFKGM